MFLPPSIILCAPDKVSFTLSGLVVRLYGVMLCLAMLFGMSASFIIANRYYSKKVDPEALLDFFPIMIIFAVIFARLYYVLLSLDFYTKYPREIFAIWHGGISIHGAIIGGLLAGIIYFKCIKKTNVLPYADVISYGLILGQAIGRWGNFFNSEAYGMPTNSFLKLYVAQENRPMDFLHFEFFHPTFLYESIWNFLVFIFLLTVVRKFSKNVDGIVFFAYLALYSVGRFFIEGLRIDSVMNINTVPIAQIVSVAIFFISIIAIWIIMKKSAKQE